MSPAVARRGVPGRGGARARGSFGGRVGRVRARAHLLGFVLVLPLVLVVALARHLRHEAEGDVAVQAVALRLGDRVVHVRDDVLAVHGARGVRLKTSGRGHRRSRGDASPEGHCAPRVLTRRRRRSRAKNVVVVRREARRNHRCWGDERNAKICLRLNM